VYSEVTQRLHQEYLKIKQQYIDNLREDFANHFPKLIQEQYQPYFLPEICYFMIPGDHVDFMIFDEHLNLINECDPKNYKPMYLDEDGRISYDLVPDFHKVVHDFVAPYYEEFEYFDLYDEALPLSDLKEIMGVAETHEKENQE